MRFVSEPIAPEHDLRQFDSGRPALDHWLREHARASVSRHTGRTFVWHEGDSRVVAYFTLAAHLVVRDELPKRIGRGSPDVVPAILLARPALDSALHGQGLGGELLWDALSRAVAANQQAAARVVVVDAVDDVAARFYEHYGFTATPGEGHRLVQKMSSIEAALGPLGV